jgi:hypothetical protein
MMKSSAVGMKLNSIQFNTAILMINDTQENWNGRLGQSGRFGRFV